MQRGLFLCVSVCLSIKSVSPAKTAEPIKMPFGCGTMYWMGTRLQVHSTVMGTYFGMCRLAHVNTLNILNRIHKVQQRPLADITAATVTVNE